MSIMGKMLVTAGGVEDEGSVAHGPEVLAASTPRTSASTLTTYNKPRLSVRFNFLLHVPFPSFQVSRF
jgi:hypothetical protein